MELNTLLIAIASMGGLGSLFSAGLAIANKRFHVDEDPRIGQLVEALPGANCGGCGYPGCGAFAEGVVLGHVNVNGCPVATADDVEEMAAIMGVDASSGERLIARVFCQGGYAETAPKGTYVGGQSCISAHMVGGGDKLCEYGCMGYGDCVTACPFDAIHMNENGIPVVIDEKCTGCNNCVVACPRDLIELHPESHKLFVLCKNEDEAKYSRSVCTVVCFSCQQCTKKVEEDQMYIENNRAFVNYEKYGKDQFLPTDKCQTGCLVYLGDDGEFHNTNPETAGEQKEAASA